MITRYARAAGVCLAILATMFFPSCSRDDRIVVGAKAFTEGYLLGHMATELLRSEGYAVEEQFGVASAAMRKALESGQVDLYFEYTGTAYTVYAGGTDPGVMADSARVLAAVRAADAERHGLRWLRPLPFNNTYTLLVRGDDTSSVRARTLGGLRDAINGGWRGRIAVDGEFNERPDGMRALVARYGIRDPNVVTMDAGLAYQALASGDVDVAMGYSTDGRIPALDLTPLEDDLRFFPAYHPAAVVRGDLLEREPRVAVVLERLNAHLTTGEIRRLNAAVDLEHRDPRKVAREWLIAQGLIQRP